MTPDTVGNILIGIAALFLANLIAGYIKRHCERLDAMSESLNLQIGNESRRRRDVASLTERAGFQSRRINAILERLAKLEASPMSDPALLIAIKDRLNHHGDGISAALAGIAKLEADQPLVCDLDFSDSISSTQIKGKKRSKK